MILKPQPTFLFILSSSDISNNLNTEYSPSIRCANLGGDNHGDSGRHYIFSSLLFKHGFTPLGLQPDLAPSSVARVFLLMPCIGHPQSPALPLLFLLCHSYDAEESLMSVVPPDLHIRDAEIVVGNFEFHPPPRISLHLHVPSPNADSAFLNSKFAAALN